MSLKEPIVLIEISVFYDSVPQKPLDALTSTRVDDNPAIDALYRGSLARSMLNIQPRIFTNAKPSPHLCSVHELSMNHEESAHSLSQSQQNPLEAHRTFVRQQHERLERVYAYGGLTAFGAFATVLAVFFAFSTLKAILPWVFAVMIFLIAMYVVRRRVLSMKARLLIDVTQYCQINALDVHALRDYFADAHTYPFFQAIFEGDHVKAALTEES